MLDDLKANIETIRSHTNELNAHSIKRFYEGDTVDRNTNTLRIEKTDNNIKANDTQKHSLNVTNTASYNKAVQTVWHI